MIKRVLDESSIHKEIAVRLHSCHETQVAGCVFSSKWVYRFTQTSLGAMNYRRTHYCNELRGNLLNPWNNQFTATKNDKDKEKHANSDPEVAPSDGDVWFAE